MISLHYLSIYKSIDQKIQRPVVVRPPQPVYPIVRQPLDPYIRPLYRDPGSFIQMQRSRLVPSITGGPGFRAQSPGFSGYAPASAQPRQNRPPPPQHYAQVARPQANYAQMAQPQVQVRPTQYAQIAHPPPQVNKPDECSHISALQEPPQGPPQDPSQNPSQGPPLNPTAPEVASAQPEMAYFANPNLQYGSYDMGHGWTSDENTTAQSQGYETNPSGMYVYSNMPFYYGQ